MKKTFIYLTFIVMAVLAVACSKNGSQVDPTKPEAAKEDNIGFGSVGAKRAGEVTPDDGKKLQIQVYDYYMAEGAATDTEYIDELIQEATTAGAWAYVKEGKTHSYSWKKGAHKFFGWVAVDENGTTVPGLTNYANKVLTLSETTLPGTANTDYRYAEVKKVSWPEQAEYETGTDGKKVAKPVTLTVSHLSAALSYTVENLTNQTYTINSISVSNVVTTAAPKVDFSGNEAAIAYNLGTDKGSVSLVLGEGDNAVKTCVWPQTIEGSKLTVNYTLGTAAATTVTVDIPDGEWIAGNYYNFKIQLVNKGIELTFTVAPWEQVVMDLDTKDDSINMSNVTWMNTKVIIDGKLENTVKNNAYSVFMYKDVEIPSYDNQGRISTPTQKYTEEVAETYSEDVYETYSQTVYDVYAENVYDLNEDGSIKTYEEDVKDPDTGNIIHAAGEQIILHKAGERKLDENGNPIVLHNAGDRVLDENGQPILLHAAGDPVLDGNGQPIVHHVGETIYDEYGNPLYGHGTVREGYFPAQGFFTVNYPKSGLFKIELIPAYGQTTVDADKYEILVYDNTTDPAAFRAINPNGETITNDTVYFQVRAASGQDGQEHKAQINIWFKPDGQDEWISAYSEIRANYALVIPATS